MWYFFSIHGQALLALAADPDQRVRDLAARLKISGRAVLKVLKDLEGAGYLTRSRQGRRNRYRIHEDRKLRFPAIAHCSVAEMLALLEPGAQDRRASGSASPPDGVERSPAASRA